jgi:putative DNA primase/helicase
MIPAPTPEQMLLRGRCVIPVRIDKRPAISSWKNYQRTRPSVSEVREWQRKLKPPAWAIVTGYLSEVVVLDFDGDTGTATLRKLGILPHVQTGSGGYHLHIQHRGFKIPTLTGKTKEALRKLSPGTDVRGDGGYAVFAGRNRAGEYQWLRQPDPEPFGALPVELQEFLKSCGEEASLDHVEQKAGSNGRVSADRLISEALNLSRNGRNNAGFWLATQLRDNKYFEAEAEAVMRQYAARVPSTNTKGRPESYSENEALASVRQAYNWPPREPWTRPATERTSTTPDTGGGKAASNEAEPDLLEYQHNDHGNAERLLALHGLGLRHYYAINRWLVWDGRRWQIDNTGRAYKLAKNAMLRFLTQAVKASDKNAESFARRSLDHKRIEALMASAECELPITAQELDRDPFLLNCQNGTLDLQTGQLREHRREDCITKLVHLEYKPEAECPLFLQFLARIMGDSPDASNFEGERASRLVAYLQKAFGYSLTGDVSEKVIFCFFGSGNNGKTTLLETIRSVLWEYTAQLQIDTLMNHRQRESNASLSDLADLFGARFVTTSEAEQGGRLAEGKLKYLSAGMGEVKTCRKYENPISFTATHKLFLDANYKPVVRGTDPAIWKRLKLIPFDVTIPPEEIDKGLLEKLKCEDEGILAWMVEGCRRWLAHGLGDPPEVTEASLIWRSEMSLLREFIEDCCDFQRNVFCPIAEIRQAYAKWVEDNGQNNPTWITGFDDELSAKGCRKDRRRIGGRMVRGWEGIQLRRPDATETTGL